MPHEPAFGAPDGVVMAKPISRLVVSCALFLQISAAGLCPGTGFAASPDGSRLADGCTSCHGIGGRAKGAIPALAGQDHADLLAKLTAFKAGKGDATIMNRIAHVYSNDELETLADYFSKVKTP